MFLKNVWYAAAWADELEAGARLARTIADVPVIFWRNGSKVAALLDRCPHRFAPLSMGQLDEAGIRCGYHGLKFSAEGRCIDNPHGPIVSALSVASYPALEKHGLIWVWLGDAANARADAIPDLSFVDTSPKRAFSKGYLPTAADHRLLVDNIMDLCHADYLHPATLGGGSMTRSRAQVEERGNTVLVRWIAKNDKALPIFRPELPDPDALCDAWTEVTWYPNGVMLLRAGATPVGAPAEQGIDTLNAHIMTPEHARRTHYFYCNSRNYKTDDEEYNRLMAMGLRAAFEREDKLMIEAQQRRIGDANLMDMQPALMGIDAAATRVRRTRDRLLAQESARST